MRFILETYVRKISPYQGEGMICSFSFGVWVTGLWWGKEIFLVLFHPGFYQCVHNMKPEQNNVFHSTIRLSPLRARNAHCTGKVLLSNVYITGKSLWGKKGKIKEHICVNAASPNLFMKKLPLLLFFFFAFWWVGGGSLTEIITAAALSRDWTTGFMWREVWSSCNRLFLFTYATPICSTHSNAMPSQNLLT